MTALLQGITPELRERWRATISEISARPLELKPDLPDTTRRWEAWWRFQADRPLLVAWARKTDRIRWDKAFDLLERPEEWLAVRRTQVENTHAVGEAIPFIRADIGPVSMGPYLGAPLHIAEAEQTTWQDPIIETWDKDIEIRPDGRWLQLVLGLLERLAQDGAGRYAVCLPDLTGACDTLANLRSTSRLCLDLFENRQAIIAAASRVVDAWERVFATMVDLVLGREAVVVQWLGAWGLEPYTLPTCDFNALIGPVDFKEVCLPSLHDQGTRAGRCLFHLDGPDAARHAQALAEDPAITAVQYTPGAGSPSAAARLPMLRSLQQAGKPIYVVCPAAEVEILAGELDPAGLLLAPEGVGSPQKADALLEVVIRGRR